MTDKKKENLDKLLNEFFRSPFLASPELDPKNLKVDKPQRQQRFAGFEAPNQPKKAPAESIPYEVSDDYSEFCAQQSVSKAIFGLLDILKKAAEAGSDDVNWAQQLHKWPSDLKVADIRFKMDFLDVEISKVSLKKLNQLSAQQLEKSKITYPGAPDIKIGDFKTRCAIVKKTGTHLMYRKEGPPSDAAPPDQGRTLEQLALKIKNDLRAMILGENPGNPTFNKNIVCTGLSDKDVNIISGAADITLGAYAATTLGPAVFDKMIRARKKKKFKPGLEGSWWSGRGWKIFAGLAFGAAGGWAAAKGLEAVDVGDQEEQQAAGGFVFLHALTRGLGVKSARAKGAAGSVAAITGIIKLISQKDEPSFQCALERMLYGFMLGGGAVLASTFVQNPKILSQLRKSGKTRQDYAEAAEQYAKVLVRDKYENDPLNWEELFKGPVRSPDSESARQVVFYDAGMEVFEIIAGRTKHIDYLNPDRTLELSENELDLLIEKIYFFDARSMNLDRNKIREQFEKKFLDPVNAKLQRYVADSWSEVQALKRKISDKVSKDFDEQKELLDFLGRKSNVTKEQVVDAVGPILKKEVKALTEPHLRGIAQDVARLERLQFEEMGPALRGFVIKITDRFDADKFADLGGTQIPVPMLERMIQKGMYEHLSLPGGAEGLKKTIRNKVSTLLRAAGETSEVRLDILNLLDEADYSDLSNFYEKMDQISDSIKNRIFAIDMINLSTCESAAELLKARKVGSAPQRQHKEVVSELFEISKKTVEETLQTAKDPDIQKLVNLTKKDPLDLKSDPFGPLAVTKKASGAALVITAKSVAIGTSKIYKGILRSIKSISPVSAAMGLYTGGVAASGVYVAHRRITATNDFLTTGTDEELNQKKLAARIYFTLIMRHIASLSINDLQVVEPRPPSHLEDGIKIIKISTAFDDFDSVIEVEDDQKKMREFIKNVNPDSPQARRKNAPMTTPKEIGILKKIAVLMMDDKEYFPETKKLLDNKDEKPLAIKKKFKEEAKEYAETFEPYESMDPFAKALELVSGRAMSKVPAAVYWKGIEESDIHIQAFKKDKDLKPAIKEYQKLFPDVEIPLILAVIHTESTFRQNVISPKGAQGYMQVMPNTFDGYKSETLPDDPFDTKANIYAGIRVLNENIDIAKKELNKHPELAKEYSIEHVALTMYHTGPGNTIKILNKYPNDPVKGYKQLNSVSKDKYADAVLRRKEQIYSKVELNEGVTLMTKKDLESLVKEVLNENSGQGYAPYPYGSSVNEDEQPEADYTEEWKSFSSDLVRDASRDTAIEVAKILVKDLELFEDVLDLVGTNQSVGKIILRKLKQVREKEQNV